MRIKYIAGNWKMHKTASEAVTLTQALVKEFASCTHKIMIAPPFTALEAVSKSLTGSKILLGAQNMAAEEQGAHTGEVSVLMLKDIGVKTVILGHSERRIIYGEKDALINQKVKLALKHGFEVILCVGETLEEREAGKVENIVSSQTQKGLSDIPESDLKNITIAYEPVWAIGTGKNATPADADAVHQIIRKELKKLYSAAAADAMIIQYGGSVKPDNAKELMAMPNIDGALVGGASLKLETFAPIVLFNK